MDDLDDVQASEFITDTDDQDSLDERIDSEQRLRNQQLWASFQNAACCLTKLYKDRAQPNLSPWVPFQNAASNLTTLYKDCIESQRRFAKIGYQVGRRRRMRDLKKWLKKNKVQLKPQSNNNNTDLSESTTTGRLHVEDQTSGQQYQNNAVTSILAVNQLNLDCDEPSSNSMQTQPSTLSQASQQQTNLHTLGNNEDDLVTFQQALVHPATNGNGLKSNQNRRPCLNSSGYLNSRSLDQARSEEDRLLELNQFLSEEYNRHVGSRKRSCSSIGGNVIKRFHHANYHRNV